MNVIVRPLLSLDEFLAWEREQELRYEFDGTQPIPMTGGTIAHARLVRLLTLALSRLLPSGYEPFGGDLKVLTAPNRVRYPDVVVVKDTPSPTADIIEPVIVFEILSPPTALTDQRVKLGEYASVRTIAAYAILPQDDAKEVTILRRSTDWTPETVAETLNLPEVAISIPLRDLYRP